MTIVFRTEAYAECIEDIKALSSEVWKEVGHGGKSQRTPQPDSAMYKVLAEKGSVIAVTARQGGNLVGYCSVFLTNLIQFQGVKQAFCDSIYMKKEYRGVASIRLLLEVIRVAGEQGAENLDFHVTVMLNFGRVLEKLGFVLTAYTYSKELTDA